MIRRFIKKWIFIFVLIISNLAIAIKTSIIFFYFFFWVFFSAVIISIFWLAVQYAGARFELARNIIKKADEGDELKVETVIVNSSILPACNIVFTDRLTCAEEGREEKQILLEYFARGTSREIRYGCVCPQRGRYMVGPLRIYFFDPFGLFFFRRTYHIYSEVYVYPKTFNIRRFPSLARGIMPWFGVASRRTSDFDDEFYGIREYKPGDSIKTIHWLSSARKNKLIVKQFQHQTFFRATIVFNLEESRNFGEGKDTISEYIVRIAASMAKYLLEKDVSVEIIAHAGELVHIPFNKGVEHLEDIFKFLAIAKPESNVGLDEIFEGFSRHIPDDSTLIVIMLDKDWEHLPAMLPLEKRNVTLFPLILLSSTFLYAFDKQEVMKDVRIKLSQVSNLSPVLFSRGDNLEEAFLKY